MAEGAKPFDPSVLREEQLRKVTIGKIKRIDGTIALVDYNSVWPSLFEREAARIRIALEGHALSIEHIGSTSVPGIAAKPIVDILLVVRRSADEPAYVPALESKGYVLRIREPHWHEHRMFKGPDTDINLHCSSEGCIEIKRTLDFRDRLRANDDDRTLYERAKRELAGRTWQYTQDYADAKSAVVEEILSRVPLIDQS